MAPKISSGVAIDGVIAYQDDANPSQWHYIPARADLILDDTLVDFEVIYYGLGASPFFADPGSGITQSLSGGILAGRARIDITNPQRDALIQELKSARGIDNPSLLPLRLTDTEVQPVISRQLLSKEISNVDFPKEIILGTTFAYNVGSQGELFPSVIAASDNSARPVSRPGFAVNVSGNSEFVGDPWKAIITADLSQVWTYVRTKVNASARYGWFSLGKAEYDSITQGLVKDGIVKLDLKEGSLDTEKFGRQIFEMSKVIFESINKAAISGEGFFRFEPNPAPQGFGPSSFSSGWWPWSVSVNASYTANSFKQTISFREEISYTGRFRIRIPCSMVLAVGCNSSTQSKFRDLQDPAKPCYTTDKYNGWEQRKAKEFNAKAKKSTEYLRRFEDGEIDFTKYQQLIGILSKISLTEGIVPITSDLLQGFTYASESDAEAQLLEFEASV
jgi:hypothetical protein